MKTHKQLDKYNSILFSLPVHHDLTPKTNSYEGVSQWNGKGIEGMSRYLDGVVTQSAQGGSPAQSLIFNRPI